MTECQCLIQNPEEEDWINYYNIHKEHGWNPLQNAHQFLKATDPKGCFFGKINGELMSAATAMKYSSQFGFFGSYWVKQPYRGKGYGLKIFKKSMDYLDGVDTIGLDCNDTQTKIYQRSGFKTCCKVIQRKASKQCVNNTPIKTLIITNKSDINLEEVCNFDKQYFPGDRSNFISSAFKLQYPIVSYDLKDKTIRGYGIVSKTVDGVTLAPLVAESNDVAQDIIQTMFQNHKYDDYTITCFDENSSIVQLISKWFPEVVFTINRMYNRKDPLKKDFDRRNIYAIASISRG